MKLQITILCLVLTNITFAQNLANCIEVLGKDSLKIYFDERSFMTSKSCASYYREARVSQEDFIFNGLSKDYYINGQLAVACTYRNDQVDGDYKAYFQNGQLKEHGKFVNGRKEGEWNYWYENGQVRKKIQFDAEGSYLKELYKASGKQLVKDGNGSFYEEELLPKIIMRGEIKNGKKHGKWTLYSKLSHAITGIETFEEGEFIKGQNMTLEQSLNITYNDSYSSIIDKTEVFYINRRKMDCFDKNKKHHFLFSKYNSSRSSNPFFDYLFENFDPNTTATGYILVGFTINESGQLINPVLYSSLNDQRVEEHLKQVFLSCGTWVPEMDNGKATETTHILSFKFNKGSYRIVEDSRKDYSNIEKGATFLPGMEKLPHNITESLVLPPHFYEKGFHAATTVRFIIDEAGNIITNSSYFAERSAVTEDELLLYNSLVRALGTNNQWKPAMSSNKTCKQYFLGVVSVSDGKPKFRLHNLTHANNL